MKREENGDKSPFHLRTFMIVDLIEMNREEGKVEDFIIFFHPDGIDLLPQFHAVSISFSSPDIVSNFSSSPVSVVELKDSKLAVKIICERKFGVCLWGEVKDSNKLLENALIAILDAFEFYNGGFSHLINLAEGDKVFLRESVRNGASYLLPIINDFHQSPLKFPSMPNIELSHKHRMVSSYFVMVWQFLDMIRNIEGAEDNIYGGTVLYYDQVVCTQLDLPTTRWMAYLFQESYLKKKGTKKYSYDKHKMAVYAKEETLSLVIGEEKVKQLKLLEELKIEKKK